MFSLYNMHLEQAVIYPTTLRLNQTYLITLSLKVLLSSIYQSLLLFAFLTLAVHYCILLITPLIPSSDLRF